jgi:predicted membrane-bound spermidine synthase
MGWILGVIFFLSGAAALIFETLWFHQMGLTFGNSVWASSIVLASFMAGLALGNLLAARYAHRTARPLVTYARLEILIAVSGTTLVWVLPSLGPWLARVLQPVLEIPWLLNLLRLSVGFVLLLAPATAMGATLPLMVRALRAHDPNFGSVLGRLYGWNTLGGVAGALVAEVVLVAQLGILGSAAIAAAADTIAAAAAWGLARRLVESKRARDDAARVTSNGARSWLMLRLLGGAALAGGIMLGLEVVWFRFMLLFVHTGSLVFVVMLAVVLAGISVGGFTGAAWLRLRAHAYRYASGIACLGGGAVVLFYRWFQRAQAPYGNVYIHEPRSVLWLAIALMLPGAVLSGMLFTLVGAQLREATRPDTRAVGLLTFANTVGAALGALLAGFAFIPFLGMEKSLFVAAALYGVVALLIVQRPKGGRVPVASVALFALFALVVALFPFGLMESRYVVVTARRYDPTSTMEIAEVREGRSETLVYMRKDFAGEPEFYVLLTNGFSMSGTQPGARRYMKIFVYLAAALHPEPEDALLISFGVGSTAKALTDMRELKSIDIVDISQEILQASDLIFPNPSTHPLRDPRVHVHVEDGRYFLQSRDRRYDIITGEPPPPKVAGVVNLYTREYFELVHERLREGGIHTYWLPVHNLFPEETRAIVRAYCDVFEDCSLWGGFGLDWILMGTRGRNRAVAEDVFVRQWKDPVVAAELTALGLEVPEQLGALFMADAAALRAMAGDSEPLVDNFPKRITDRVVLPEEAAPLYEPMMETDAAARRFANGAWTRQIWPAALHERSLRYFDFQRMINATTRPRTGSPDSFFRDLHRILTKTNLQTLVLWHMGLNADVFPIIDRHERAGSAGPYAVALACRALARRDFDEAAGRFGARSAAAPADRFAHHAQLYALCMAGRSNEARRVADRVLQSRAPDESDHVFWRWMQSTLHVQPPARLSM